MGGRKGGSIVWGTVAGRGCAFVSCALLLHARFLPSFLLLPSMLFLIISPSAAKQMVAITNAIEKSAYLTDAQAAGLVDALLPALLSKD